MYGMFHSSNSDTITSVSIDIVSNCFALVELPMRIYTAEICSYVACLLKGVETSLKCRPSSA
jgi:hypothetical protein